MPNSVVRATTSVPTTTTDIYMFFGSKISAPKKVTKKATSKVVKKVATAGGSSVFSKNRLRGKDNGLVAASRSKTSSPELNIDNYQEWGPLGGLVEAVQLLRGLSK